MHCYIGCLIGRSPISIRIGADLKIILLKLISQFTEICIVPIKLITIPDDLADIGMKLCRSSISFALEILFDGLQVHRLFDYIEIVGNI